KPVIIGGLLVFAVGSLVAALADSIYIVILGRALQGSGAIAAAVMALTADLTREEQRTKAMAIIGASIGLSFAVALVMGPVLAAGLGLRGVFWVTCALAVAGIAVLYLLVPTPVGRQVHRETETVPAQLTQVLRDASLLRLDLGILVLHMVLMASFVAVPLALKEQAALAAEHHWKVYLGVLAGSVVCMTPFVIYTSRTRRIKGVFAGAVVALTISLIGLGYNDGGLLGILLWMLLFFTAFNILEATLPSLVSRVAPAAMKGTALGVYSTSQFLGAFIGGSAGGVLFQQYGAGAVFAFCAAAAGIWLTVILFMPEPKVLSSRLLPVGQLTDEQATDLVEQLTSVAGVADAVVVVEDCMAYLKVDRDRLDEDALQAFAAAKN
ncbi:MAG: MFS transporter, partial [Gammaproteobacteria bacterium]